MIIEKDKDAIEIEISYNDWRVGSARSLFDAFSSGSLCSYVSKQCSIDGFICSISATNYNDQCPYKKSVEDVSEETRYILEEFIIERASEDGVDMGLVKPIIDIDLVACRIEQAETLSWQSSIFSTTISPDSADCSAITDDRWWTRRWSTDQEVSFWFVSKLLLQRLLSDAQMNR